MFYKRLLEIGNGINFSRILGSFEPILDYNFVRAISKLYIAFRICMQKSVKIIQKLDENKCNNSLLENRVSVFSIMRGCLVYLLSQKRENANRVKIGRDRFPVISSNFRLFYCLLFIFFYLSPGETSLAGEEAFTVCKGISAYDDNLSSIAPLVILDPGHGGTDEGAKVQSVMEKRIALTTALMTKKQLEALGYRVIMTRSRDTFLALAHRVEIANKAKAALFVSIHYNSSPNPAAKGIEIYYYDARGENRTRASKRLANLILHQVVDQTEAHSRGVRRGNFYVVRETSMPAVLVEGGFMTNYDERFNLKDRKYLEKIAKGIAQGVHNFLKAN